MVKTSSKKLENHITLRARQEKKNNSWKMERSGFHSKDSN